MSITSDRRRSFQHRGYWVIPTQSRHRCLMDVGNLLSARSTYWTIVIPGQLPLRAASKAEAIAYLDRRTL